MEECKTRNERKNTRVKCAREKEEKSKQTL